MGAIDELHRVLAGFHLIFLDTMVFSYHLAGHPRYQALTHMLLRAVETGQLSGLTTTVTLAELLAPPAQIGNREAVLEYEIFLTRFPNLRIVPFDVRLAREVAWVRAETRLRLPDAIQVAAGRLYRADALITNNHRLIRQVAVPRVILLDNYTA